MDPNELRQTTEKLLARYRELEAIYSPAAKRARLGVLEERMGAGDFWNDREQSRKVTTEASQIKPALTQFETIRGVVQDIEAGYELLELEADPTLLADIEMKLPELREKLDEFEVLLLLSDKYDNAAAIVSIHPGAGGTESQDWAEYLLRMYQRYAENKKYKVALWDRQEGDGAGIKSATLRIEGLFAYGHMKAERGVHRLVRISPFDAAQRRHTSFASVDVSPEIEDDEDVEILEKDLKIDTYRSSGAGGQHVNVTDSAVRITHLPSGIVVSCQNERSQIQNREVAMSTLRSRLYQRQVEARLEELSKETGVKRDIAWGSQIRSYVFHPYKLIKDHRTGFETGNIDKVMDGYLDDFIKAFLLYASKKTSDAAVKASS